MQHLAIPAFAINHKNNMQQNKKLGYRSKNESCKEIRTPQENQISERKHAKKPDRERLNAVYDPEKQNEDER
jgi:hypothetical protein